MDMRCCLRGSTFEYSRQESTDITRALSGTGRTIRPNTTISTAMAAGIVPSRTTITWTTSTTGIGTPRTTGTTTEHPNLDR